MTRKRDRYQSAFDGKLPGTLSARYDVMLVLWLLERYLRTHELLDERVQIKHMGDWSLGELLAIAREAREQSIEHAMNAYLRLCENADAARTMAAGFPLDTEWAEMAFALERTLANSRIVSRGEVSRARLMAKSAEKAEKAGAV